MKNLPTLCFLILLVSGWWTNPVFAQKEIDFDKQVMPILKKHCAACHNGDDYEAGFSVESYEELEEGSDGEAVFEAGDSESSWMIQLMTGEKEPMMPPDDQPRPTKKELETLKSWIDQGANDSSQMEPTPKVKEDLELFHSKPNSPVTASAWSKKNLIAIGRYRNIQILNPNTREAVAALPGEGKVNSLQFSADGSKLLSAGGKVGQSGVASLWDVETREKLVEMKGHADIVYAATLSPDESLIATAGYDRKICIWEVASGDLLAEYLGHNGAIFDLAFSGDSKRLISASADQTVKVWSVESSDRLETLGQPLKGLTATTFSADNRLIVGGGMDQRIWIWESSPEIQVGQNRLVDSRFAHEGPIVQLKFTPDGARLVSSSEDLSIKVWDVSDFQQLAAFENQSDIAATISVSPDSSQLFIGRLDGSYEFLDLTGIAGRRVSVNSDHEPIAEEKPESSKAFQTFSESEPNNQVETAIELELPAYAKGAMDSSGETADVDLYKFAAKKGQRLVVETRAARNKSKLDSRLEIIDGDGEPVPQVMLRAVRESYFTFRGKNSSISDDFRIHNWEQMQLNEYLYCNGEVVKLFHHPRGPDSGFLVYPGRGKRRNYFGTTATSHALHENCYVVQPFSPGTEFQSNGLPFFELNYENDDGSDRKIGRDSRIDFVAPADGEYWVRVSDARGFQGEEYHYRLEVRPALPDFNVNVSHAKKMNRGSGTELTFIAERIDGFDAAIQLELSGIPEGVEVTNPIVIQAGHDQARGTLWVNSSSAKISNDDWAKVKVRAVSTLRNKKIVKDVGGFQPIEIAGEPKLEIRMVELDSNASEAFEDNDVKEIEIQAGKSVEAKVVLKRNSHQGRVSFGQADAGRNLPHGVYVDNIGLNGLMVIAGQTEQRFFITADSWVQPQERMFFIRANDVDGLVSRPIKIKIIR